MWGVTRAKRYLYISYCRIRYLWGNLRRQEASRFLKEMPKKYMEKFIPGRSVKCELPAVKREGPAVREKASPVISFKSVESVKEVVLPPAEVFSAGDFIFHKDFGIGQVKESYEGSMGLTYKVHFNKDDHQRTLIAKYAVLNKL